MKYAFPELRMMDIEAHVIDEEIRVSVLYAGTSVAGGDVVESDAILDIFHLYDNTRFQIPD